MLFVRTPFLLANSKHISGISLAVYNVSMDTIKELLGRGKYAEPPEVAVIKNYVQQHFASSATVNVQARQIVIVVSNAALAGTLRLHNHHLAEACRTDKRLVIRIGM